VRRFLQACLLALALALAVGVVVPAGALLAQPRPAPATVYRVIFNPRNPASSVDRRFLADAFLKKVTRWGDGEVIRPVDLTAESYVRQRFSEEVLKRSLLAVKSYWQQLVFSGRNVPPPELGSEAEVVRYVLKHKGALGYVSGDVSLDGAKVLSVR
jgi:hypothetical protein